MSGPAWWDGEPMRYGQVRHLPGDANCAMCKRRTRTVHVRDLTIFGREFRPVLVGPKCVRRWDTADL